MMEFGVCGFAADIGRKDFSSRTPGCSLRNILINYRGLNNKIYGIFLI